MSAITLGTLGLGSVSNNSIVEDVNTSYTVGGSFDFIDAGLGATGTAGDFHNLAAIGGNGTNLGTLTASLLPDALGGGAFGAEAAARAVHETQFIYNKGARPNWARGPVGATIFTFKAFSINYLEFLKRLPAPQRALRLLQSRDGALQSQLAELRPRRPSCAAHHRARDADLLPP